MPTPRLPAFTLIEVAAAMAIAGVIGAVALTAFAMLNGRLAVVRAASVADTRAKSVIDHLVPRLQQVGGASVRPGAALAVHDNDAAVVAAAFGVVPSTPADDRLLFSVAVPGRPECTVQGAAVVGPATFADAPPGSQRLRLTLNDACCTQVGSFFQRHVMLTTGSSHRQAFVVAVTMEVGGLPFDPFTAIAAPLAAITLCEAEVEPGITAITDTPDGVTPAAGYAGGTMTIVEPSVYYVDAAKRALVLVTDDDLDGQAQADEARAVAVGVAALEVQLGYDCDGDGRLRETTGVDEWQLDDDDVLPAGCGADELRAVQVSLVVGNKVSDPSYQTSVSLPGGRAVSMTGVHLRAALGTSALRNAMVPAGLLP